MRNRFAIFLLLIPLFGFSVEIEIPPTAPTVNESNVSETPEVEDNNSLDSPPTFLDLGDFWNDISIPPLILEILNSISFDAPPEIPEVLENDSELESAPEIPEVSENDSELESAPEIPEVLENDSELESAPEIPEVLENDSELESAPEIPEVSENSSELESAPEIPEVSENSSELESAPEIPEVSENSSEIESAPEIPEVSENSSELESAPEIPEVSENIAEIVSAPEIPEVSENIAEIVSAPEFYTVISSDDYYVAGGFFAESESWKSLKLSFENISKSRVLEAEIDVEESAWFIKFPKIEERYIISLEYIDVDDVKTTFYIDSETFELVPLSRITYIQDEQTGQYIPDVALFTISEDNSFAGDINFTELESSLETVYGRIESREGREFQFEAIDTVSKEVFVLREAQISGDEFGFKLPKDREYALVLNLLSDSGVVTTNFYLTYDGNSSTTVLYSANEVSLNSNDIPIFDRYYDTSEKIYISTDIEAYYTSQYYFNGTISWEGSSNIIMNLISSDGRFIGEELLLKEENYTFSTRIGRDMAGEELFIILKVENETIEYCYDANSLSIKMLRSEDWSGQVPNREKFEPVLITSNNQSITLDLDNIKIYKIFGNIIIPVELQEEVITLEFKDENGTIYTKKVEENGSYQIEFDDEVTLIQNRLEVDSKIFSLEEFLDRNSMTFGESNSTLFISDELSERAVDMNLTHIWKKRNFIYGDIYLPSNISGFELFVLDKHGDSLGSKYISASDEYTLYLDSFGDETIDVIFKVEYFKDGENFSYFIENSEFIKNVDRVDGVIDSSGIFQITGNKEYHLDISSMVDIVDSRRVFFSGNILSDSKTLSIEIIDAEEQRVKSTTYITDVTKIQPFEMTLYDYGNYIFKIYQETLDGEQRGWFYNPDTETIVDESSVDFVKFDGVWVLNTIQTGVFEVDGNDRNFTLELDLITASSQKIYFEGNFSNLGSSDLEIYIYKTDGETLLGSDEVNSSGNFKVELSKSALGESVILKVVDLSSGESYYLGSNPAMLGSEFVDLENKTWSDMGINPILITYTSRRDIGNWSEFLSSFQSIRYSVSGTVNSSEDLEVTLIDLENGETFKEKATTDFKIYTNSAGEYAVIVKVGSELYLYNPDSRTYILFSTIDWEEISTNIWVPKKSKIETVQIESTSAEISIDSSDISNSIYSFSGEIIIPPKLQILENQTLSVEVVGDSREVVGTFEVDTSAGEYIDDSKIRYRFEANLNRDSSDSWNFIVTISDELNSESETVLISSLSYPILDLYSWGDLDKRVYGDFKAPVDFDFDSGRALISLYSAVDGEFFKYYEIGDDRNYTLNVGESGGNFIVGVSLLSDELDREFFLDFEDDNFTVNRADEVSYKKVDDIWVPAVNFITIVSDMELDIEIEDRIANRLAGTVQLPSGSSNGYIRFKNYSNGIEYKGSISENSFEILDVQSGTYRVDMGFEKDDIFYSYFVVSSSSFVSANSVSWIYSNGRYYPDDTFSYSLGGDKTNFNFDLSSVIEDRETYSLSVKIEDANFSYAELFSPGTSINYRVEGPENNFTISGLTSRDDYYLLFYLENREYFYDGYFTLVTNVDWYAFDKDENRVCPTSSMSWDCSWSEADSWIWKPQVETLDLFMDSNYTFNMPSQNRVSANLKLGDNFENSTVDISLSQFKGEFENYKSLQSDSNGEVDVYFLTESGEDFRLEVLGTNFHFVTADDSGVMTLISQENSWSGITPKENTLFDISGDYDFGDVKVGDMNLVEFVVANLQSGETILIQLKDEDGNVFEDDNLVYISGDIGYEAKLSIFVPNGTYSGIIYPSKHSAGYILGDEGNLSRFAWSGTPFEFDINSAEKHLVTLAKSSNLKSISGVVNLGSGDIESGWIEISDGETIRGEAVSDNGVFKISGIEPNNNYTLTYYSWEFPNLKISKSVGMWFSGTDYTGFEISQSSSFKVYGDITVSEDAEVKAMLIDYSSDEDWSVVGIGVLDSDGSYNFEDLSKAEGKYIIGAGVKSTTSTGGSKYKIFGATDGSVYYQEVGEINGSIIISVSREEI
jgi:hypothetical protein